MADEAAPPVVKCATCCYFRALTAQEKQDSKTGPMRVQGDGFCFANPPGFGAMPDRLAPGAVTVAPVRPPTNANDVCRFWRPDEFAGDAEYGLLSEAERIADELKRLANYVAEGAGARSSGGLA